MAESFALAEPRFVDGAEIVVSGFAGDYTRETTSEIPAQWDRFNAALAEAGLGWKETWGVVYPTTVMRYVSGVEMPADMTPPEGWEQVVVPAQHYAVFAGEGGVAAIRQSWMAIFSEWLPQSGRTPADGPMLERYQADWSTTGAFEIWISIKS